MSLKEDNLRFVVLKAVADAIAKEVGDLRSDHLTPLLERYDDEGTKTFEVRLPGPGGQDVHVATLALKVPKDSFQITDYDAFLAWAESNHKDIVHTEVIPGEPERTVVVPAVPERVEKSILPKGEAFVMKQLKITEDGIVDPSSGTFVDGVSNVPGSRPNSFAVTFEHDGPEHLAGAYRTGKLDHIIAGTSLPAINPVRIERRLEVVQVPAESVVVQDYTGGYGRLNAVGAEALGDPEELGSEYSDGYTLPGEPEMSPAREALEHHADELADRYSMTAGDREFDPGSW